jgi:two-component sensor histidine kinase
MQQAAFTGIATEPEERDLSVPLAEAHHRIVNSLSLLSSVIRVHAASIGKQTRHLSGEEVQRMLQELVGRIESVGQLHKLLTRQPKLAAVDIGEYLRAICEPLANSIAKQGLIEFEQQSAPGLMVRPDQAPLLALIVSELVTNAIKYAHPTGVAGHVAVSCSRERDDALAIEVADDGIGLPEGFDPQVDGDFGFRIMRAIAEQLHATLTFHSTDIGLRVRVLMPASSNGNGGA